MTAAGQLDHAGSDPFRPLVFLAASLWLMLDPPFSPRTLGYAASPLAQYYLSALVAGYCAGYFLAIGSQAPALRSRSRVQAPDASRFFSHFCPLPRFGSCWWLCLWR